ncbi:type IV toxin-antitoxin system AbiEi family antitoxin domain-containing protein [Mesorhizobium sp. M0115]|uniref:type IV toxin-antitoxin system AbiEi family antitoxin domain-containing protein n=1 Tax=Mesorhizobium sp. M0115 TaxID=2956883 RepID=UPI00333A3AE4
MAAYEISIQNYNSIDLAAKPTLYPDFNVNIRGWENDNEEEARAFASGLLGATRGISRYLDLSRLEFIVVGTDYYEALASVDRGQGSPAADPTSNEYGQGAAMAMHVMRNGEIWSVVIWMPLVRRVVDEGHEDHKRALHTIFHELVHVDDLRLFTKTYPGGWKEAKPRDGRDDALQRMVNPCQSEYSAQRRSAWVAPEVGLELLDMLGNALKEVDDQIRTARLQYRLHGDMNVFWPIVIERLTFLFQAVGYGIGHADSVPGLNETANCELPIPFKSMPQPIIKIRKRDRERAERIRLAGGPKPSLRERAVALAREKGEVRTCDLTSIGIPRCYLARMCNEGLLIKVG